MTTDQQIIDVLKPLLDELLPEGDFRTIEAEVTITKDGPKVTRMHCFPIEGGCVFGTNVDSLTELVKNHAKRKAEKIASLKRELAALEKEVA